LTHLGSRIFNGEPSGAEDSDNSTLHKRADFKSQSTQGRRFKEYTPVRRISKEIVAPNRYNSVQKSYQNEPVSKNGDSERRREQRIKEFSKLAEYGNIRRNYLANDTSNTHEAKNTYFHK